MGKPGGGADQQRYQLEATYLTLTSNLVTACINEAALRAQIAATREIISAETQLLAVLQTQYNAGQDRPGRCAGPESRPRPGTSHLPPCKNSSTSSATPSPPWVGIPPDQILPQQFTLDSLALPKDLPVSIPAALLHQRPDILQAEANLHQASALVGVAIANRLPSLTLSATGGSQSNYFRDLFASGNGFWTLAASVTQPVFDGGTLLHKARAAWAALDQAKAQYRATTLSAFQNVADTLAALNADADTLAAARTAERAAQDELKIIKLQVSLGQAAYLAILNAQQTALAAELTLIQAKASRLTDTAALFQAMGGGWWNRNDAPLRDSHGNDPLGVLGVR